MSELPLGDALSLPKEWVETTLGEVANVQTGPFGSQLHNKDYVDIGTPMITVEHIVNDKIYHASNIPKVSDKDKQRLSKYLLEEGDIVFSRVGSVDRSAFVSIKEDGWMFSGRLLRVRGMLDKVDPHFLHFLLTKKATKEYIKKVAVGATMPSINTSILSEIPLVFPPLPEQKAIAKLLSSFDEKIELLQAQNETLETLAQTIFKEWFVNFNCHNATGERVGSERGETPKGLKPLSDFIEFNPIEKINRKETYLFFDMKSLPTNSMVTSEGVFKQSNSGTSFREGDTLFAKITPCLENGKTAFVLDLKDEEIARGSTEFIVMRANEGGSPYLNYCISRDNNFRDYAIRAMIGTSGRQRVPVDRLKTYQIKYTKEIVVKFNNFARPLFNKVKYNANQIQTLKTTRDILLPKLMSGEVRVEGFE